MKKSSLILVCFAAFVTLSMVAQIAASRKFDVASALSLSGKISERTYEALPIKHLDIRGPIQVILTAGLPSTMIKADEAILDKLVDADPDPERLLLELPSEFSYEGHEIIANISMPALETISLSNTSSFKSSAPLTFKNNRISSTGYCDIDLEYEDAEKIHISGSGSSNVKLGGRAANLIIEMTGASEIDATNMLAGVCEVNGSGATSAAVYADSLLRISMSGSATVKYSGNAKVEFSSAGSASLQVL